MALYEKPENVGAPLERLNAVFGDNYVAMSPADWEALGAAELEQYSTDSLVLFDRDLGSSVSGDELLLAYRTRFPAARTGIFTSTATPGQEEIDAEGDAPPLVTSKSRLAEDGDVEPFIDELRLASIAPELSAVRNLVLSSAEASHEEAVRVIRQLDLQTLEHIVVAASRHEGVFEGDTLIRVLTIRYRDALRRALLAQPPGGGQDGMSQILAWLDVIRARARKRETTNEAVLEHAASLMRLERYTDGAILNRPGLPLANGDIFSDNVGALWMVVDQPCDLQLRDTGGSRVAMTHTDLISLQSGKAPARCWPLPRTATSIDHPSHLVLSGRLTVPFDVLELAVLRSDGSCRWKMGETEPDVYPLTPALAVRAEEIRIRMEGLAASLAHAPPEFVLRMGALEGTVEGDELCWPLTRVERLAESWAAAALSALAADKARPGLEGDFIAG